MKRVLSAAAVFVFAACQDRIPLSDALRVLDIVSETTLRADRAISIREEEDGVWPEDGTPLFIEQACSGGGMAQLDIHWNTNGTKMAYWGCVEPPYTLDGCVDSRSSRVQGDLHVASSSVSGDCPIDYQLVFLDSPVGGGGFSAADGIICGYDWIDDVFCPRGGDDRDGFCAQLRAQVRDR